MDSVVELSEKSNGDTKWTEPRIESPSAEKLGEFHVSWTDLTYHVETSKIDRALAKIRGQTIPTQRYILKGFNGSLHSGQMTALMGPSGAGKSTLLDCIACMRIKNRTGSIKVHGRKKVSIGFIPQKDHLFDFLTVREAITYASELQNSRTMGSEVPNIKPGDHGAIVYQMLHDLGLEVCADTRISNISGGQMKRVSIGQELVSKPDILILDEPTSGLDSSSCFQTVELLHRLTQKSEPIAILMTIHQPPARIFNMFHKVYMLSTIGKPIYEGSPSDVVSVLAQFDVHCSQFYNPADLLIEVASGDYGDETIRDMAESVERSRKTGLPLLPVPSAGGVLMENALIKPRTPFFTHFRILSARSSLLMLRDPMLSSLRVVFAINAAVCIGLIYQDVTLGSGCPPRLIPNMGIDQLDSFQAEVDEARKQTLENIGGFYFILLFTTYSNLVPTATVYPLEIQIFQKERYNGWYSPLSFFLAKVVTEIPFMLTSNLIVLTLFFWLTDQPFDRYWLCFVIYMLISMVATSHGTLIGIIFRYNIVASVFAAPNSGVPLVIFSGFFIRPAAMPRFFEFITRGCYLFYGFSGYVVAMFGFNRCNASDVLSLVNLKRQFGTFLGSMFRLAFTAIREEETDGEPVPREDLEFDRNRTRILVKSILKGLSGGMSTNEDDDETIFASASMAYYGFKDVDYFISIFSLILSFIIIRVICYVILKKFATLKD